MNMGILRPQGINPHPMMRPMHHQQGIRAQKTIQNHHQGRGIPIILLGHRQVGTGAIPCGHDDYNGLSHGAPQLVLKSLNKPHNMEKYGLGQPKTHQKHPMNLLG
jgi:hypothetical protein